MLYSFFLCKAETAKNFLTKEPVLFERTEMDSKDSKFLLMHQHF